MDSSLNVTHENIDKLLYFTTIQLKQLLHSDKPKTYLLYL